MNPAFFPRFLKLADGYFVSSRDFAVGQQVFRFSSAGELLGSDTLALGETYFSYDVNGSPHLVSQQATFAQSRWTMRTVLYLFDTQGFYSDSVELRTNELAAGESPSSSAYYYENSILTFMAGSVSPTPPIIDFRVWLSTYDGTTVTNTPPWDPGPLEPQSYITSWGILRTHDARFVLSAFIRGDENMQFWFFGLESDGTFNSNLHTQNVADNHLLNGLIMKEISGSLVYAFTEVTTDGSYGGGAQIAAFPLDELLDADDTLPELPSAIDLRAYPNPFNATSTIEYQLAQAGLVKLAVYDVLGREVNILADELATAGVHKTSWSADNFASGKYFLRLATSTESRVIPITLTK
ncbi:MAG: T9SS type A sorting domain-containing protein [bacterium]|nr:T9SS type A sorting domain-containing protein [bacterium]